MFLHYKIPDLMIEQKLANPMKSNNICVDYVT